MEPVGGGQGVLLDGEQVPGGPPRLLAAVVEGDRVGVGQHPGPPAMGAAGAPDLLGRTFDGGQTVTAKGLHGGENSRFEGAGGEGVRTWRCG